MKKPTAKRIILWSTLLLVLLCAIPAGVIGYRAYRQQQAVEAIIDLHPGYISGTMMVMYRQSVLASLSEAEIEAMGPELLEARFQERREGGRVFYNWFEMDFERVAPDWIRRLVGHHRCLLWFDRPVEISFIEDRSVLFHAKKLPSIETLIFWTNPLKDSDLIHLESMSNLKKLHIGDHWASKFSSEISDDGLVHLTPLQKLEVLQIDGTSISSDGLKHLAALVELKELSLRYTAVDDAGLLHLKKLHKLERLHLSSTDVTDKGLEHLKAHPNLSKLFIAETKVTVAGLKHLEALPKLNALDLSGTAVGNDIMIQLGRLPKLKRLNLARTRFALTETKPKHLDALHNLEALDLSETSVTDAGLKRLATCANLQILILQKTQVSDAGLKHIESMPNLEVLNLYETAVTKKEIDRLYSAMSPSLETGWPNWLSECRPLGAARE